MCTVFLICVAARIPIGGDISAGEWLAAQMLPVFTFERECGTNAMEHASDYVVPDWFYEDEQPVNADLAVETTEAAEVATAQQGDVPVNASVGVTYDREHLSDSDFLLQKIFVVDSNTSMTEEELSTAVLLDQNLAVSDIKDMSQDKILIYHTHGSESFADSREGVQEDTIIGVGAYLAQLLEERYGIAVYHDETLYDVVDGQLDRSRAYEMAYDGVSQILRDHPSIEVVVDLHRDGVNEDVHLVTEVDGKQTAKIMFLNGVSRSDRNGEIAYLENPYKNMNLAFSFQMYLKGKELYGDYVRKIYVRSLRYNLHLMPRATLIEAGAQTNTLEEERNAMEPLARILNDVLSEE